MRIFLNPANQMIKNSSILINSRESVVVFVFTVVVSLFWFSSQVFNVYHEPLLGALYEFLSIVMLLALFRTVKVTFWLEALDLNVAAVTEPN